MKCEIEPLKTRFEDIERFADSPGLNALDTARVRAYHAIAAGTAVSRKVLAERLGIRPSTVSDVSRDLIEEGLVSEGKELNTGRKGPPEYSLRAEFDRIVGIGVYVSSHSLVGLVGNIAGKTVVSAREDIPIDSDADRWLECLERLVGGMRRRMPGLSIIGGSYLCLPGSSEHRRKEWVLTTRWPRIPFVSTKRFNEVLDMQSETYRLIDAKLEYLLQTHPSYSDETVVLLHWGYGIGVAVAQEGRILTSPRGGFGEIGHWPISRDNPRKLCRCGSPNCLEIDCALWSIEEALFPGSSSIDEEGLYAHLEEINRSIRANREKRRVLNHAVGRLAVATAQIFTLFNPDRILLYGPPAHLDSVLDRLICGARSLVSPRTANQLLIEITDVTSREAVNAMNWYPVKSMLFDGLTRKVRYEGQHAAMRNGRKGD